MENSGSHFWVGGWSKPRWAFIEGATLKMEVSRESCRHCPTCSRRIRTVESQLRGSGVDWRWDSVGYGLYLAVPAPGQGVRVADYLTDLLGLSVATAG